MPEEHSYHALDAPSDEDLTYEQFLSGMSAGLTEISQEALDFLGNLQLEATPPGPRQHATSAPHGLTHSSSYRPRNVSSYGPSLGGYYKGQK